jgi:hypothetical protein
MDDVMADATARSDSDAGAGGVCDLALVLAAWGFMAYWRTV